MTPTISLAVCLVVSVQPIVSHEHTLVKWRNLVGGYCFAGEPFKLNVAAPGAADGYEQILKSPFTSATQRTRLYNLLAASNIDRPRFLHLALLDTLHAEEAVRFQVALFIGSAGSVADTPPLLVLLEDPEPSVKCAAIDALGQIGDERTVLALDIWLRQSLKPGQDQNVRQGIARRVVNARDQIKARLAAGAALKH